MRDIQLNWKKEFYFVTQRSEGFVFPKKKWGLEGMQRAHGRFESPGKDNIEITAKTI